jgi:hypothetical protein
VYVATPPTIPISPLPGSPCRVSLCLCVCLCVVYLQVLERAAGGEANLKAITARIVGGAKRHSLQHALLAGLPFKGCATPDLT